MTTDSSKAPPSGKSSGAGSAETNNAPSSETAQTVTLAPDSLPRLNIVGLAQSGQILRAERETPPDGVPVFVTKEGWNDLLRHYGDGKDPAELARTKLLPALERISTQLLAEAAQASKEKTSSGATPESEKAGTPSVFTLESDLFPGDRETRLVLVRDETHPVVCALLGTPAQLAHLLSSDAPKNL